MVYGIYSGGKSAVLTAIVVVFGGKAASTQRAKNMSGLINESAK
jgi:chromosome segregation ATPase